VGSQPKGISGSRAAAVLGLSEFVSRFEVWQQIKEEREPGFNAKRGYIMPVFEGNASTRWGLAFEDAVIHLAEQKSGQSIVGREHFYQSPMEGASLTAHIDGAFSVESDEGYPTKLHNGKTTNAISFRNKWGEPGTAAVPQSYAIQAQHDMLVSGAEQTILSVLVFPEMPDRWEESGIILGHLSHGPTDQTEEWCLNRRVDDEWQFLSTTYDWARILSQMGFFHQYIIPADISAQEAMLESYRKFWRDHIEGDAEPSPETPEDVARAFPAPVGTLIATDQIAAWIAERNAITDEIGGKGPLSKRKDQLKVDILNWARAQDAQVDDDSREKTIILSSDGRKLATWNGKTFR